MKLTHKDENNDDDSFYVSTRRHEFPGQLKCSLNVIHSIWENDGHINKTVTSFAGEISLFCGVCVCVLREETRKAVSRALKVATYNEGREQGVRNAQQDNHMLLTSQWPITLFMDGNWAEARN